MKKLFGPLICMIPVCAFAQGIGEVAAEPSQATINQSITLTINSAGETSACGIEVNLGDGTVRQIRAQQFPVKVEHTYKTSGTYAISVTGRGIVRGLNSVLPCAGSRTASLVVAPQEATNPATLGAAPANPNSAMQPAPVPQAQVAPTAPAQPASVAQVQAAPSAAAPVSKPQPAQQLVGAWSDNCFNKQENMLILWSLNGDKLSNVVDRTTRGTKTRFSVLSANRVEMIDETKGWIRVSADYHNVAQSKRSTRQYIFAVTPEGYSTIEVIEDGVLVVKNGTIIGNNQPVAPVKKCTNEQVAALSGSSNQPLGSSGDDRDAKWRDVKAREIELVKEADAKGPQAASASPTKFKLFSAKDQMTGRETLTARYEAALGGGKGVAELYCEGETLTSKFTFHGVSVPTTRERGYLIASGRQRLNGKVDQITYLNDGKFSNVFVKSIAPVTDGRVGGNSQFGFTVKGTWEEVRSQTAQHFVDCQTSNNTWLHNCESFRPRQAQSLIVYDLSMEITTAAGPFFVDMSPYDPAIKRVAASCKK